MSDLSTKLLLTAASIVVGLGLGELLDRHPGLAKRDGSAAQIWPGGRVISITGDSLHDVDWTAANGRRLTVHWDGVNLYTSTNQ